MEQNSEYLNERMKDSAFANEYKQKLDSISFATNPKLYILVGNIGSGKSTWVKQNKKPEDVVISLDNLRYCFNNGEYKFDVLLEQCVFNTCLFALRQFCNSELKPNIYMDNTSVNIKSREQFIKIAKGSSYEVVAVIMPSLDKENSISRRMNNSHGNTTRAVWEEVWERFNRKFQYPSTIEGFDKIIQL